MHTSCARLLFATLYLSTRALSAPLPSECNCPTSPLSPSTIDYVLFMTVSRQLTPEECAFICNPSPPRPVISDRVEEEQSGVLITKLDHQQSEAPEEEDEADEEEEDKDSHMEKSPESEAQQHSTSFASSDGFPLKDFSAAANRDSQLLSHVPIRPPHAFSSSSLPLSAPPPAAPFPYFGLITAIFLLVVCLIEYSRRHTTGVSWAPRARRFFSISGDFTREVEAWRVRCGEETEGTRRWGFEKEQERERGNEKDQGMSERA
ncbi:hypothetical protein MMC14_007176 [Varicellaria rhodocarpa]|nr:hypothetical protein [Varicellaria rhodocarpa]